MLELKNISYAVPDEKTGEPRYILSDVTLSFPEKSITVITGHNGSGKSTLVKLIMGIERPTSGRVIFNGRDITELSVTDHARAGFTIALQQPVRFKGITVRNLLEAARNSSCTHAEACDILSMVGLCAKDYIDRPVDNTLSGGELKRIELAPRWQRAARCSCSTSPKRALICGASTSWCRFSTDCAKRRSSSSAIRVRYCKRRTESPCSIRPPNRLSGRGRKSSPPSPTPTHRPAAGFPPKRSDYGKTRPRTS